MTNEEICAMIQAGTGDRRELLEQLYLQNAGMIEKIVRRFGDIEDPEDLRQEAYFGIVRAAELYDPGKGYKFMSYAGYWIRQAVRRYIDDCGAVVRIPVHRRALIARYHSFFYGYRMRFGRYPDARELCAFLELTPGQLEDLKQDVTAARIRSTSEPIGGEDEDFTIEDTLADPSEPYEELIDKIQREELGREIWACVDGLSATASDPGPVPGRQDA